MNKPSKQKGAALLLFIIFFTVASLGLLLSFAQSIYSDIIAFRIIQESKQSFAVADSFAEDMAYRYIAGLNPDTTEVINVFGAQATATASFSSLTNTFTIATIADRNDYVRKSELLLQVGVGASFNFGVQTGNGGFRMTNSSAVNGNLFSNGTVEGQGSSIVRGDVISAGPTGLIDGIHATGSAWANNIVSGLIEGDAYYQTIDLSNTSVWGTLNPGWPDEATTTLPIPDDVVVAHQASTTAAIAAGDGTLYASTSAECSSGTFAIDSDTTFSGPTKIECDFEVSKNSTTFTIQDTLWVAGNISFQEGPTIEADPATSTDSILIIADDPSNRSSGSTIDISNSTEFRAATSPKSYIVLLSMNNDAENGGSNTAITMGQSSDGDVLVYAGRGKVDLGNQISLKEVTGYTIEMGNNTTIDYESGLLNLNFTSGPGGGFEIAGWSEVE